MPLIAPGEYRPDVADYEAATTKNVLNVFPRGDGYGPVPSLTALSAALGAQCVGAFLARKSDGTVQIFAGTATNLYTMNNTTFAWSNVSKGGGPYSSVPTTDQWRFVQFNSLVIAVQINTAPQVFTLGVSAAFADLSSGSANPPPQCRYIDVVGRFVVLSGISGSPQRVQWSGLNDVNGSTSWQQGVNSSDYQDLPDGGFVRGVAGGESGIILQDAAVRRMSYLPGSTIVFQIERIADGKGIYGPYSIVRAGSSVFFFSNQGFHRVDPGGFPTPIGRERVDRTFLADLDQNNLQLFMGTPDPRSTRVLWAYKSVNGTANQFDKILAYDYVLDRFTPIKLSGEYLLQIAQPGQTLEGLDNISTNIDSITQSFDNFALAATPELGAFDANHSLNFFRGSNLEATIESAEQGTDGKRVKMRGFRPVTDAATLYGSASKRETQGATAVSGTEYALYSSTGIVNTIVDTRYLRMKARIPAATSWSFFGGFEPDMIATGRK